MQVTKYQRLVTELEQAIISGRLIPGAKLPSVREFMRLHGLSLSTVTTALHMLEERGLIEPKARSGYYIKTEIPKPHHQQQPSPINLKAGYHWWPDGDLFPRERLRKLTASIIRRYPDLNILSPRNNNPRLVRQLAARCAEIGCYVWEDDILVTHGITEALSVALRSTTKTGDKVVVQSPVSPLYRSICHFLGLVLVPLDSCADEPAMLTQLAQILKREDAPRVILLAGNFHCPTGEVLSIAAKQEILGLAKLSDVVIIEDDSSGDLYFGSARPLPLKAFDQDGKVIYATSATKVIAPGLQVGWLVSSKLWNTRLEAIKSISASAVDQLPQLVLAEFLDQGSHLPHLRKLCSALQERISAFESTLRPRLGGVQGLSGKGGGFNRFLWSPGRPLNAELETVCQSQWPELFSDSTPFFRFRDGGISVNLSFALNADLANSLGQFGDWLTQQTSHA